MTWESQIGVVVPEPAGAWRQNREGTEQHLVNGLYASIPSELRTVHGEHQACLGSSQRTNIEYADKHFALPEALKATRLKETLNLRTKKSWILLGVVIRQSMMATLTPFSIGDTKILAQ